MIGLRGQLWRLSWIAALVLGFSVWGSDALAHTGRVNSFSISPTSNLTPGHVISKLPAELGGLFTNQVCWGASAPQTLCGLPSRPSD